MDLSREGGGPTAKAGRCLEKAPFINQHCSLSLSFVGQVAVDSAGVMGCIDIRLPRSASSKHPLGVPNEDAAGAYILNVVVNAEERGRGFGKMLMRAAMSRAVGM